MELDGEKKGVRRRRDKPNKVWAENETKSLIEYVKSTRFEKPTAKTYYTEFLRQHMLDFDWTLARNKVRNLRFSYQKARDWLGSLDNTDVKNDESIFAALNKACPFYNELEEIFPKLDSKRLANVSEESSIDEIKPRSGSDPLTIEDYINEACMSDNDNSSYNQSLSEHYEESLDNDLPASKRRKFFNDSHGMQFMHEAAYQKERQKLQRISLDIEQQRLDFEKEKADRDFALREKQLKMEWQLRKMEIESRERIAYEELKLKYMKKD